MDSRILQSLASNSPNNVLTWPSASATIHVQLCLLQRHRLAKVSCTNSRTNNSSGSSTSSSEAPPPVPTPITPPDTVNIRFKRGSRRRRRLQEDGFNDGQRVKAQAKAAADQVPKKWEEMSIAEKALELYMGEKGLLFWLNKFAYTSIFIVIGAWILFRFVGPALNLYELDSSPLSPTSMFKGS